MHDPSAEIVSLRPRASRGCPDAVSFTAPQHLNGRAFRIRLIIDWRIWKQYRRCADKPAWKHEDSHGLITKTACCLHVQRCGIWRGRWISEAIRPTTNVIYCRPRRYDVELSEHTQTLPSEHLTIDTLKRNQFSYRQCKSTLSQPHILANLIIATDDFISTEPRRP